MAHAVKWAIMSTANINRKVIPGAHASPKVELRSVNLRYFVGLTVPETAEALGVSVTTVEREWRFLRTFLQSALGGEHE